MSIGVAVPGPFNCKTGRITLMSGFPGWNEIDLREILTGPSGLPVFVDQDANCGALAELWCERGGGVGHDLRRGGPGHWRGAHLDYGIYPGHDGYAGEIGHSASMRWPRCSAETGDVWKCMAPRPRWRTSTGRMCSTRWNRAGGIDINAEWILQKVREGDRPRSARIEKTVAYLCRGAKSK